MFASVSSTSRDYSATEIPYTAAQDSFVIVLIS